MTRQYSVSASSNGLTVKAFAGDRCVMLAFNLDDHLTDRLAGFAIARRMASQPQFTFLGNRLGFAGDYTSRPASKAGKFFSSDTDPFQKFWWLDFPSDGQWGTYEYQVTVKRFNGANTTTLVSDQQVTLSIDVSPFTEGAIEVAFTRGYLSSQAYADKFNNAAYLPPHNQIDGWKFDTQKFQNQWAWLGGHARQAIIDFFIECRDTPDVTLDAFVYDLNEPDIINALIAMGPRLRILSDNSTTHADDTAAGCAYADIVKACGGKNARRGHFQRFQHNKVLIKKDKQGNALKVLTGSTNFSITGLYVNANHVVVFDSPAIAEKYEEDFQKAFDGGLSATAFEKEHISQKEFTFTEPNLPKVVISYAPHEKPTFSLKTLLAAIKAATGSVIFAVMDLDGQSNVLSTLKQLHDNSKIFSYGISDSPDPDFVTVSGSKVYTPTTKWGELVYSKANPKDFPEPFSRELEVTGGAAHVVHHKFVVVDFNGIDPVVFCGSSNLADGGEQSNGDNLIAIYDRAIATAFAIEGIRLVDHYLFAAMLASGNTQAKPLRLKTDQEQWWKEYYEQGSIKETERKLFSR